MLSAHEWRRYPQTRRSMAGPLRPCHWQPWQLRAHQACDVRRRQRHQPRDHLIQRIARPAAAPHSALRLGPGSSQGRPSLGTSSTGRQTRSRADAPGQAPCQQVRPPVSRRAVGDEEGMRSRYASTEIHGRFCKAAPLDAPAVHRYRYRAACLDRQQQVHQRRLRRSTF